LLALEVRLGDFDGGVGGAREQLAADDLDEEDGDGSKTLLDVDNLVVVSLCFLLPVIRLF
jgi:hypothetical protein